MGYSLVVGGDERSADFEEVLEFTMGVDCRSSGLGSESAEAVAVDLHHSLVWHGRTLAGPLFLVLDSAIEVFGQLVFEG